MPMIPNECSLNYCFCIMNIGSCFQRKELACSEVGASVQFLNFLSVIGNGINFQDEVSNNAFLRNHIENGEALRACSMDLYGIRDSSCD